MVNKPYTDKRLMEEIPQRYIINILRFARRFEKGNVKLKHLRYALISDEKLSDKNKKEIKKFYSLKDVDPYHSSSNQLTEILQKFKDEDHIDMDSFIKDYESYLDVLRSIYPTFENDKIKGKSPRSNLRNILDRLIEHRIIRKTEEKNYYLDEKYFALQREIDTDRLIKSVLDDFKIKFNVEKEYTIEYSKALSELQLSIRKAWKDIISSHS